MGNGFVPQSAMATAQMIAGQQAQALSQQAAQQSQSQGEGQGQGQGQGQGEEQGQGQAQGQGKGQGKGQSQGQSQGFSDDPNRTGGGTAQAGVTGDSTADATLGQPPVENEPWFAKLPPETQEAIRTKAQRPAPRGYEEKLRRYFDSIGQ
jgi:hypothetical protein